MGDTTSIDDLPTDPSVGNGNNIVIQKTELPQNQIQPQAPIYSPTVNIGGVPINSTNGMPPPQQPQNYGDGNVMNELITGLQRASANGLTTLPSRDIPRNSDGLMNDEQIRPNYVPRVNGDYISQHELSKLSEVNYIKQKNTEDSMEYIYEKLQLPILLGILYFIFQLPVTRKYLVKYIPGIFMTDGNFSIIGLLFISTLFAGFCYLFSEGALHLFSAADI